MDSKISRNLAMKILAMIVLGAIYSGSSILILFFINKYLLTLTQKNALVLASFFGLLAAFLISSILSRIALSAIGHNFVFDMRMQIIKRILDTPNQKIAAIGKSNLLASLSSDIISLTNGFTRIPDIIQGSLIISFASFYIAYLSHEIFLFLLIWMSVTIFISNASMKNIYKYYGLHRQNEDTLYKDYQTSIEGHRELSLNLKRAKKLYNDRFVPNAKDLRSNIIKAEIYSSFASNWISAMMLGAIGAVIYICLAYQVTTLQDAITIALTILFLRAPLMMVVSSIPSLFKSKIAYEKLKKLDLTKYEAEFSMSENFPQSWDKLSLKNINFKYDINDEFGLHDINLEINKGEVVFLVGKNGSGKSTLFMILAGLLKPNSGEMYVDDLLITKENLKAYANTISAVFSDFYLFDEVLSDDDKFIDELLKRMFLDKKVSVKDDKFSTLNLSQGQRKRLAMVAALLEKRKFIILDEWAADQDPQFRKMFYKEILNELKQDGYTVFAISHDDAYFECADKIYSIENGNLSQIK
ncbi:cyclic peptide export ABC transporter [Campylobacter sp. MOP51]|uniref:cyclic peptide export ABC transporter n=1 Tax=Campylobacter canis TaxID=3378588 RepID=UPI003C31ABC6